MRICLLLLVTLVCSVSGYEILQRDWEEWKALHGKSYSFKEELKRRYIWEQNLRYVIDHNLKAESGVHSYRLEINQFADLNPKEWLNEVTPLNGGGPCNLTFNPPSDFPDSVDWRKRGVVAPPRDQGQLGKSWTFSATGALEGQKTIRTGKLVKLSEQNLADCATADFSPYCEAGGVDCAFYYVMKNGGIDTEEGYPMTSHPDGKCRYTAEARGATCTGCVDLPAGDEKSLHAVAKIGPIAVSIDASHTSFQLYQSGVYYEPECSETMLDHSALLVGYGEEDGVEYWIVRNSWGADWGENGYIRMARNKGNNCGIASAASYPTMEFDISH